MKTFLVVHRGALGDFLLTFPALSLLRWKHAGHRFIGLGRPEYLDLARQMGLIDAVFDCESSEMLPFFTGEKCPPQWGELDAALLWLQPNAAMEDLLQRSCSGPVRFHPPFPAANTHVLEHHLECLPFFSLPEAIEENPYFPIDDKRRGYALIHPGSGSRDKNFDPQFYGFLANELQSFRYKDTRLVLGPLEADIKSRFLGRYAVEEPPTVWDLARLISGAALYVGNDSGVSHLASLLGTPTLALYKTDNLSRWGVRGRQAQALIANTEAQAMTRIQKALRE